MNKTVQTWTDHPSYSDDIKFLYNILQYLHMLPIYATWTEPYEPKKVFLYHSILSLKYSNFTLIYIQQLVAHHYAIIFCGLWIQKKRKDPNIWSNRQELGQGRYTKIPKKVKFDIRSSKRVIEKYLLNDCCIIAKRRCDIWSRTKYEYRRLVL